MNIQINSLTNANIYIDGVGLLGRAEEIEIANPKHKMIDYKGLGMAGTAELWAGVEKLESKKLIIRTTEGKLTNVYPTPKAKEILPRLNECLSEFYGRYAEILGKEECGRFVQNMVKMTDKLRP